MNGRFLRGRKDSNTSLIKKDSADLNQKKMQKIKTKVVHSESKAAWNVVGTSLGAKYKIARCPYLMHESEDLSAKERKEAFEHAQFISKSFNDAK